jgi:hypothetical protein
MGNPVSWGYQPSVLTDPGAGGAIPVTEGAAYLALVSAGAEARTLPDPQRAGQRLTIGVKTHGGAITITAASPIDQNAGELTAASTAVGDMLELVAIDDGADLEWRIVGNDGFTIA